MPIITTTIGEVNLLNSSAKISLFATPKGKGTEKYISLAAKEGGTIKQRGAASFSSSVQGTMQEIGGRCVSSTFDIDDDQILKVFVKINRGYGKLEKVGCFFIRPRTNAAYRRLKITTLEHQSVLFRTAKIEGCFDMLSLEEATAEGVLVNPKFRRMYDPTLIQSIITSNEVLTAERKSRVKKQVVEVLNEDTGQSVKVVKVKRRRAITL